MTVFPFFCHGNERAPPVPSLPPLSQSDVYAFGVLMLRLATNLPALLDAGTPRSTSLNEHVRRALLVTDWEGRGATAAGGRRPEDVPSAAWAALAPTDAGSCAWEDRMLASFGALALRCTEAAPEARPLMTDLAASLEGLLAAVGPGGRGDDPTLSPESLLLRGTECKICMDEPRATAFLPCRHSVACVNCAQDLLRRHWPCPFCRAPVASFVPDDGVVTFVPAGPLRPPAPLPPPPLPSPPAASLSVSGGESGLAVAGLPPVGAALTWPRNARASLQNGGGGGAPKLVRFPPRDAAGGTFASLRVRGPSLPRAGPFLRHCPSFWWWRLCVSNWKSALVLGRVGFVQPVTI